MKRRRLRKRHGHAMGLQAITRPAGGGLYDVVLVDGRGNVVRKLVPRVPYEQAKRLIRVRQG